MSNYETKPNTGAIFKNEKKADAHPDYKGKINVDGVDKEIALWLRESKAGVKYFSVVVSEPFVKQPTATVVAAPSDDLPF